MDKKRIVKDYDKLPEEVIMELKQKYPYGYADNLISILNKEGVKISALPFETNDVYYLIRMTVSEANQIVADDDDFDNDGNLKDDFNLGVSDEIEEDEEKEEEEKDESAEEFNVGRTDRIKNPEEEDNDPSESPDYF